MALAVLLVAFLMQVGVEVMMVEAVMVVMVMFLIEIVSGCVGVGVVVGAGGGICVVIGVLFYVWRCVSTPLRRCFHFYFTPTLPPIPWYANASPIPWYANASPIP